MIGIRQKNLWYEVRHAGRAERLRLFCFPYAGGNSRIFQTWQEHFPENIAICAIELPGRNRRTGERLIRSVEPMVQAIADGIKEDIHRPFAFYGHSMGAIISFELARELRRRHGIEPLHMFVGGRQAPQLPSIHPKTYDLPDPEFLAYLRKLKGTPDELLRNDDMMQYVMPVLRADFELVQTYSYKADIPLSCPITVYGGVEDVDVPIENLQPWAEETSGNFTVRMFPGGHFFLQSEGREMVRCLRTEVYSILQQIKTPEPVTL